MHLVADDRTLLPDDARLARVIDLSGFGSRTSGEALVLSRDGRVLTGQLLAGMADADLAAAHDGVVEVRVGDAAAADAGLACGGTARILLQRLGSVPDEAWTAIRARRPIVLGTDVVTGSTRSMAAVVGDRPEQLSGSTGTSANDDRFDEIARGLLRSGRTTTSLDGGIFIESLLPPTRVVIVGIAAVGDALAAQAALLGWATEILDDQAVDGATVAAMAGSTLSPHDALVVLSHDPEVDTPALAAALRRAPAYVGALGSRHTQDARRHRLAALGFSPDELEAVHGPVGLDLGSRTPAEAAVAIVAEIIAHRSGRDARSLHSGDGPING